MSFVQEANLTDKAGTMPNHVRSGYRQYLSEVSNGAQRTEDALSAKSRGQPGANAPMQLYTEVISLAQRRIAYGCDRVYSEWKNPEGRCAFAHASAVGFARYHRPHGHQVRLRHGTVRGVHRSRRRPADALVRNAGCERGREACHHYRGALDRK